MNVGRVVVRVGDAIAAVTGTATVGYYAKKSSTERPKSQSTKKAKKP